MQLHPDKCQYLVASPTNTQQHQITTYPNTTPISPKKPNEPARYLGIDITASMNWKPTQEAIEDDIRHPLAQLSQCNLTPQQAMRAVTTVIHPKTIYKARHATMQLVEQTDRMIRQAVKKATTWTKGMAEPMLHDSTHGAAMPRLQDLIDNARIKSLTERLCEHDQSITGAIAAERLTKSVWNGRW